MTNPFSTALKVLSAAALSSAFAFSPTVHAQDKQSQVKPTHVVISRGHKADQVKTSTPIKHVVVIFQENVSFDHYFGTYPYALNPKGEPEFHAKPGTPQVNNLLTPKDYNGTQPGIEKAHLMSENPNSSNPSRLDRSQALTGDMDHGYAAEQTAVDGGKMDQFVQATGHGDKTVMDYFDGNTVTALWNYAQNFAMSDNSFGTNFGPSSPGALNLISGDTTDGTQYSANSTVSGNTVLTDNYQVIGDPNPYYDSASTGKPVSMKGTNVGNLLNDKGITWGWFQGGFDHPTTAQHKNIGGNEITDYSPHHEPFQYFQSTANPTHAKPSSPAMIGKTDQANHQYDLNDFWTAVDHGNMPAVSYLKAPMYQDGHAGYSDPLDEQNFLVDTINKLEKTPEWKDTAVIISYDDSDGWYDHVFAPSNGKSVDSGQFGYGPRLPLLVISPYAKTNFVDHTLTDQSSILKFIEDNWNLGRIGGNSLDAKAGSLLNMFDFSHGPKAKKLFLNDKTGEPQKKNQ